VRNTGDADLVGGAALIVATPPAVFVDRRDFRLSRNDRNVLQIPLDPILRYQLIQLDSEIAIEVRVPPETANFGLRFRIWGEGLATVTREYRFVARRQPAPEP
jgi:hypothetical protein